MLQQTSLVYGPSTGGTGRNALRLLTGTEFGAVTGRPMAPMAQRFASSIALLAAPKSDARSFILRDVSNRQGKPITHRNGTVIGRITTNTALLSIFAATLDPGSQQRRLHGAGGFGEGEVKGGAVAEFARSPDTTTLSLHEVFDDGQAEAGAALLARAGLVHAIKAREDAFEGFGGNAGAVVANEDFDVARWRGLRADGDGAAVAAILDGVINEVAEDLAGAVGV